MIRRVSSVVAVAPIVIAGRNAPVRAALSAHRVAVVLGIACDGARSSRTASVQLEHKAQGVVERYEFVMGQATDELAETLGSNS